ncbi:uncharacterized protein LOC135467886 [Liolophura sinensis]|uniref:uncharacterized protein LOC135467886 n=1 Tax=Liolophura sinensis TaxID=3198878 RepID=UPI003157F85E
MSSVSDEVCRGTHIADLVQEKLHLSAGVRPPIVKTDLDLPDGEKALAFVLDNVYTKQECDEYIKKTEEMGYEKALLNTGGDTQMLRTDVRNSYRCIWDSVEEGKKLWQRIQAYIPVDYTPGWQPVGLNERLRFLRYDPGEYFKPHYDGSYQRKNGEKSFITIQLYLNEGFEGGNTTFLSRFGEGHNAIPVVPRTGSVLIFKHHILHEGSILVKGRKYSMRSDIMFERLPDDS